MIIQSTIPVLYPLKEKELPVQATSVDGKVTSIEVTVEGMPVLFERDVQGRFIESSSSHLEPAYAAYIERQLSRCFN